MPSGWILLEEDVHPSAMYRIRATLNTAGVPFEEHEVEEDAFQVLVEPSEENRHALRRGEELVRAYEAVVAAAHEEGVTIRPYKPLERSVLLVAGRAAEKAAAHPLAERLTALLHEFVWAQPLPNANHRSALLLVAKTLKNAGVEVPDPAEATRVGNTFARESKLLIAEKEFQPDLKPFKARHREVAARAVASLLTQS